MPSHPLNLTKHQQQVLGDLGIDAWYLQPLTNKSADTQQAAISEIVEALSASLQQTDGSLNQAVTNSPLAATKAPVQYNDMLSVASSHKISVLNKTLSDDRESTVAGAHNQSERSQTMAFQSGHSLPPSIALTAVHSVAPVENKITFPETQCLADYSWQGVDEALSKLNAPLNNIDKTDELLGKGFGKRSSDWLFVMPPSPCDTSSSQFLSLSSKQLMTEWLACLGKTFDEVYITPMIKKKVKIPRDPDSEWLVPHLSILLTEIGLIRPKHIFLMGRLPCQKLLSSSAPLSELMKMSYQLDCSSSVSVEVLPLTCLPSLDYFLKLPPEKSWLWQVSKSLSQ